MSDDERILSQLTNIEQLLKALIKATLRGVLDKEFSDTKKAQVFELTGDKSRDEISAITQLSTGTISGLWQKWELMGLLEKDGKVYKRVI